MARQRPTRAPQVEIDRIFIREVQYQLKVNWCRNEEIIVKGNFGWAWPMWEGCPWIDRIVIREVQYQFEVNRCRNKEIIVKLQFSVAYVGGAPQVEIDRIVIREFQGSSAYSVGGDNGQDGQTDGRDNLKIPTLFKKLFTVTTIPTALGTLKRSPDEGVVPQQPGGSVIKGFMEQSGTHICRGFQ
ncbi:hypothetical protein DPMN_062232 [Dreissena polymorpha]|uniref:Uncharacterized protein n=1 Tax=Dreissena polymorpha TaxID=45954 RepID=A0A9D4C9D0_DREPO|nr:hypothetical protein DPMN_062232 [Dreissena polymorpha]